MLGCWEIEVVGNDHVSGIIPVHPHVVSWHAPLSPPPSPLAWSQPSLRCLTAFTSAGTSLLHTGPFGLFCTQQFKRLKAQGTSCQVFAHSPSLESRYLHGSIKCKAHTFLWKIQPVCRLSLPVLLSCHSPRCAPHASPSGPPIS